MFKSMCMDTAVKVCGWNYDVGCLVVLIFDCVNIRSSICVWVVDLTCICTLPLQFAG